MMKTNNKFYLWLILPVVLVIAGLVMFFTLGFNLSGTVSDGKSIVLNYDPLPTSTEDLQKDFEKVIVDATGSGVVDYKVYASSIEINYTAETDEATLSSEITAIQTALSSDEQFKNVVVTYTLHTTESEQFFNELTSYAWRAALSVAIVAVAAGVYVAVRYQISKGIAVCIATVLDTLATIGLVAVVRVPVSSAIAVVAVLTALYTVLTSFFVFNKQREAKEEGGDVASAKALGEVAIMGGAVVLIVGIGLFMPAVREFAIASVLGVLISTYSALTLTPALASALAKEEATEKESAESENEQN